MGYEIINYAKGNALEGMIKGIENYTNSDHYQGTKNRWNFVNKWKLNY
jgi:hypothetical protein